MARRFCSILLALWLLAGPPSAVHGQTPDPLPSWHAGPAKQALLDFVARVTREGGPDFVPLAERNAVFDNDGTLWSEQPVPGQVAFTLDRPGRNLAEQPPKGLRTLLGGDLKGLVAGGTQSALELVIASHAGATTEEFEATVKDWLATARHARFKRPYTDLAYQPMLEVLALLRAHGFRTWIVSGGSIEFMRCWAEQVYGIPPEQVIGSTVKLKYELRAGQPVLVRQPEVEFFNEKASKPIAIQRILGRRPVAAFGNSDGDLDMLQWTTNRPGPGFGMLIHHTDADREWAYDRNGLFGRLEQALAEAPRRGWTVVDMKKDWQVIYPFQKTKRAP